MKLWYTYYVLLLISASACHAGQPAIPGNGGLWTLDISHDDKYIAIGGDDSLLRIYTTDLRLLKSVKMERQGMIKSLQWHPRKNILAIASRNDVWVYDPFTGAEMKLEGAHGGSRTVGWNYTGDLVASAGGRGIVWIWNSQGNVLKQIQKNDTEGKPDQRDFLGIDWHPTQNLIATVGDEIRIFDTTGQQQLYTRHRQQVAGLLTVKWHPSGTFFAIGDYGHAGEGIPTLLQFWKPDGTLLKEIKESKLEIRSMRWSKDGSRLATASDAIRIWSKDGELLHSGPAGNTVYWGVDWLSDARRLFTVNFDTRAIQEWSPEGKLLRTIE